PLGVAPDEDWNQFWLDLQDFVCIVHRKVIGLPFYLNGVARSDAGDLLKALRGQSGIPRNCPRDVISDAVHQAVAQIFSATRSWHPLEENVAKMQGTICAACMTSWSSLSLSDAAQAALARHRRE